MKRLSKQELAEIDSAVSWTPRNIIQGTLDLVDAMDLLVTVNSTEGFKEAAEHYQHVKDRYDPYLQAMKHYDGRKDKKGGTL